MADLVFFFMTTGAQLGITGQQQLGVVISVCLVAVNAINSVMRNVAVLFPSFPFVEMATHAQVDLRPDQQIRTVRGVGIMAGNTGPFALKDVLVSGLFERLRAAMALQAQGLAATPDSERTACIKFVMALGAISCGKRFVLVLAQQSFLLGSVGIMTGCAIRLPQGAATVSFFHGHVIFMALDTQSRNALA
jgi:hypothetical protein